MSDQSTEHRGFLQDAGWHLAEAAWMQGDASARRYQRLTQPDGETAILMLCPPGSAAEIARFCEIARHLRHVGLTAPRILARDDALGLLLLEDFGEAVMAAFVETTPASERTLYLSATKLLHHLHSVPPMEGLKPYGPSEMAAMVDVAFTEYATATGSGDPAAQGAVQALLHQALERHAPGTEVMILRDYHAENLMILPDRDGVQALGLLDFQDALCGHRGYDLISLLEDARRDIHETTRLACISWYAHENGLDPEGFEAALCALGAQRNLRILGVFARLARTRGKPAYLAMMPRVWQHLERDLAHPALADLNTAVQAALPAPTPDILERLHAQCPTP